MYSFIATAQGFISFLLIVITTLLIFMRVIFRYVFGIPLMGLSDILFFAVIWLYFVGAANASFLKEQVRARVLESFLKKDKTISFMRLLGDILTVIFLAWAVYHLYQYIDYASNMQRSTSYFRFRIFYREIAIFVGIFLMFIYHTRDLIQQFIRIKNRDYSTE